jgi:hypothetical protein
VVNAPSQRDFEEREVVLLRGLFCNLERPECGVFEVAVAVHAPDAICFCAETAVVWLDVFGFDFAGEETAGEGVVDDNVDAVFAARWDELGFDGASCRLLD